ncbi:MAG: hypothetical protein HY741_06775 [Chloroflexi bacterium]|nr:hypothetical protein [Chloroflexota bacterium]
MIEFLPQIPETRVASATRIRRERLLPIPGQVSGAIGIRIGAQDVIARAYPPKMRRAVSLTRVIGVTEADVPKRLVKQVGDQVEAREIIIAKPINFGVQRLVYRAPEAGQITAIQGSWMILDLYGQPYDVCALYRGTIVGVLPRQGGLVEAQGALIQGVWGSSAPGGPAKEAVGVIKWISKAADAVLDANALEADARGAILVAGGITDAALQRAGELQASGILVGSLAPEQRQQALALNLPVVVTEGFGEMPMSASVFELLTALNGQEAALNGRYDPRNPRVTRPELFVPLAASRMLQSDQGAETPSPKVAPRARVRGLCAPYLGRVGVLPDEFVLKWIATEAGTYLPAVQVEWQDPPGEHDTVPWTNLELIG